MSTVVFKLIKSSILNDMMVTSHAEVAPIANPQERYLAELGTEKGDIAHQCINNAVAEVWSILRPFLSALAPDESPYNDTFDDQNQEFMFTLEVTPRKAAGLGEMISKAAHAYVVDSALAKFYTSVSRTDLASKHAALLDREAAVINNIIYQRTNPSYT